jgi:DNA-binding transcriptional LysR family regulator
MDLYQLNSFLAIATTQNLTKAAHKLNLSQSALSSQIKLLEDELQVKLFERTARGMLLTEHGRTLHSHALETIASAESLKAKATELSGRSARTLKIGLNTDGAFLKVSKLSRNLIKSFPKTNFVFVSSQTIRTAEMLRQGLIDIGFFFGKNFDQDIISEVIGKFSIKIVIPSIFLPDSEKLITWPQLAALPWIWSVYDCPYYRIIQAEMDTLGLQPNTVVDAMDESVVKELVLDNQGIAILREDDALEVASKGDVLIWENTSYEVELRIGSLLSNAENHDLKLMTRIIVTLWE